MKTFRRLFPKIIEFENLLLAAKKAMKGKSASPAVAVFNFNLENELICLKKELETKTYQHGPYRDFFIHDPKERLISAAPFRDRVVHHALCNIIEPLFDTRFIHDSYACRKGKGVHRAVDRYQAFCRKNRFVLKCDLVKYFASIDHEILLGLIRKKIQCRSTRWLIEEILGSRQLSPAHEYFPGDDLFSPFNRVCGLPLGNLTSQFFGNLYLNGFDHYVKERLQCRYYIRYVDDFVIFGNAKEDLHHVHREIESYLGKLRLRLHKNKTRVYRVKDAPLFLGFRTFPTHRRLDRRNVLAMRKRMKMMQQAYAEDRITAGMIQHRIRSWIGHAGHANTFSLRKELISSIPFVRGESLNVAGRLLEQQR